MEIALAFVVGVLCIVSFLAGAKVGQTVAKGESIDLPTINPLEAVRERQAKKEAKREQDRLETIMQNIENYNGTSAGQKDVP